MWKRGLAVGAFGVTALMAVFLFQNCGDFSTVAGKATMASNEPMPEPGPGGLTDPDSTPPAPEDLAPKFKAGDPFAVSLVPYTPDATLQAQLNTYEAQTGFKAVVLAPNGQGLAWAARNDLVRTQQEWTRVLLERCQLLSMNRPCSLFAEGNTIKYNEADFFANHRSVIDVPETFDAMKLPGVIDHWRNYHRETYATGASRFRSIAISWEGTSHTGWSDSSQEESNRRTLEFCEVSANTTCALYAEGNNVVFDLATYRWAAKRVFYGPRTFDLEYVPFISDSYRTTRLKPVYDRVAANQVHAVFAMNRYAQTYIFESPRPITAADQTRAIAECNRLIPSPDDPRESVNRCFIYSIDMEVLMTRQSILDARAQ